MRGVPGSGKTTWIKNNLWKTGGPVPIVCSADNYFYKGWGQEWNYVFDSKMLRENHDKTFALFTSVCASGAPLVVLDNTNTQFWEFELYVDVAYKYNYSVEVVRMETQYQNVHGVPEEKVRQMMDRFDDFPGELLVKGA